MSPRTGRPKVENPKDVDIKVRLDSDTNRRLLEYCKAHDLTRAEVMRKGLNLLLSNKN